MSLVLLTILVLLASISPLLTFAALWQLKEWRWDRLREHLRETGWLQLIGKVRPLLLLLVFFGVPITLTALTLLNVTQILLKKQRYPVWTTKALVLTTTSLCITALLPYSLLSITDYLLVFLPLFQPLTLALALVLWKPIDHYLKQRILSRAKHLRSQFPHLTVIGITGSVGKTTTKELLTHLLQDLHPIVTPEHVNTELGVAQWLIQVLKNDAAQDRILIVEMGAYRKGEIKTLCASTQPTIGIITYIGKQHLGLFGSQKNLCDAKGELFEALPSSGHAFLGADSPYIEELKQKCQYPCHIIEKKTQLKNPHFNADLPAAVAKHLGVSDEDIQKHLKTFSLPQKTFTIREENGITVLDDTHNSSPESFRAAIEWARKQPHERKILLAAGIIELGKESKKIHKELGTLAAPIFQEAIILNNHCAKTFELGFGKPLQPITPACRQARYNLQPHSLLVCIGRIPQSLITKITSTKNPITQ